MNKLLRYLLLICVVVLCGGGRAMVKLPHLGLLRRVEVQEPIVRTILGQLLLIVKKVFLIKKKVFIMVLVVQQCHSSKQQHLVLLEQ